MQLSVIIFWIECPSWAHNWSYHTMIPAVLFAERVRIFHTLEIIRENALYIGCFHLLGCIASEILCSQSSDRADMHRRQTENDAAE